MTLPKNNLAIVPARGGSKRLSRKNIRLINGKPLIHYTLEAILNSGCFETVILSSDDDEILEVGSRIQGVIIEKREVNLAQDTTKVIDLIKSISNRPGYDQKYSTIGLFLPTCPFRTARHIREGLALLTEEDFSVVSTCEMGDPIQLTLSIGENSIIDPEVIMKPSPLVTGQTRSQDFEKIYRVNGGFYIAWTKKLKERDNYFQGRVKGYVMPRLHSIDIDHEEDLEYAKFLLDRGFVKVH